MRAVIFANGLRPNPERIQAMIRPDDLRIAADGGARNALACGVTPHLLVGDFDSLTPTELSAFRAAGAQTIEYPVRKDYTDLELAMQQACERQCSETLIVGGLGARWDQTLANLLLPAAFPGMQVRLVDGLQELSFINPGKTLEVRGQPGDTVSLIPVGGDAENIVTDGLEYPLSGEALVLGSTRGVSNVLLGHQATISLGRGLLICIVIHQQAQ
jgi:thiamine pyrophosphokinase